MNDIFADNIFSSSSFNEALAFDVFRHQYQQNKTYEEWCNLVRKNKDISNLTDLPFLPISFFKTRDIKTGTFEPEVIFTSSGTTQTVNSRHFVKKIGLYRQSFLTAFEQKYGSTEDLCIIGLLPSYLERSGSSLIYMAEVLIGRSKHPQSGFYLYDFAKLYTTLQKLEAAGQQTILLGVTFALLDFADAYSIPLSHTIVMETGGMKGRKKELLREEVHAHLMQSFGVTSIHSEYGMTELLSQAYSKGNGIYRCPPWMKVLVRNEEDPLQVSTSGRGVLNIIDLANLDSCAFIATDDAGIVYEDGSFEVLGRVDNSDLRGCSLLTL